MRIENKDVVITGAVLLCNKFRVPDIFIRPGNTAEPGQSRVFGYPVSPLLVIHCMFNLKDLFPHFSGH